MATNDRGARLRRREALALIESQPRGPVRGAPEILQRLCGALTQELTLAGATVTLVPHLDTHAVAAASSNAILHTETLQFDAGEGPTRDAHQAGEPVLAEDLQTKLARWPGYAPAALATGVHAALSFPLHVGAARLGALSLYWTRPQRPTTSDLRMAGAFAEIATEVLIDDTYAGSRGGLDPSLDSALGMHHEVYQAQGMVMVDLRVSLPEALARMRAHAYTTGVDLDHLARDIIDGKLFLVADTP